MGTKIEKCMNCENPARYVNHTQFAGTHYWCDHCVPAEDKSECEEIKTCANPYCDCAPHDCINGCVDTRDYWSHMAKAKQQLNPAYITHDFQEHYAGGFATRPTEVTCTLKYCDPQQPLHSIQSQATAPTAHKAKTQAYKQLEMLYKAQQEAFEHPSSLKDRFETRAAKVFQEHFTTMATTMAEKNQYLLDKLQEEAAEIIQAVSKIRRFGPDNHHPDRETTNLQELISELEDFQAIVWALEEIQYLDPKPSTTSTIKKYQSLISS